MEIKNKKSDIKLQASLLHVGSDILVVVSGGDKPHIGASVLANESQVKSISFKFHKDDIVLKIVANELRKHTKKNICVIGGIHVKDITKKQIEHVIKMSEKLAKKIVKKYVNK